MVWATPRKAPNKEYLEFELQPAAKSLYTPNPTQHKKNKTLMSNESKLKFEGIEAHTLNESANLKEGATKKGI